MNLKLFRENNKRTRRRRDRSPPARFRALSATGIRDNFRRARSLSSSSTRRRSFSAKPTIATTNEEERDHHPLLRNNPRLLGIGPTLYGVNEAYVEGEQENLQQENATNNERWSLFRGRKSTSTPYSKTWNESQGVVDPMVSSDSSPSSSPSPMRGGRGGDRVASTTDSPVCARKSYLKQPRARHECSTLLSPTSLATTPRTMTSTPHHSPLEDRSSPPHSIVSFQPAMTSPRSTASQTSSVNIYLLLVEPHSKIFELIDLTYPRHKTTIADLLRMIPRNATEQMVSTQRYIGFTRPKYKKHQEGVQQHITDLRMLASNSIHHDVQVQTANICHGEVVIAIPSHATARQMVHLARPILANPRIQQLMAPHHQKTTPPRQQILFHDTPTETTSTSVCTSRSSGGVAGSSTTFVSTTPVVCSEQEQQVMTSRNSSMDNLLNRDIVCSGDDGFFEYCEREIQRAAAAKKVTATPSRDDDSSTAFSFHTVKSTVVDDNNSNRLKVWSKQMQARKRRWNKWMRKLAPVVLVASVLWYHFHHPASTAEKVAATPLGITGSIAFVVCMILLIKGQRLYDMTARPSQCPFLQLVLMVHLKNTCTTQ